MYFLGACFLSSGDPLVTSAGGRNLPIRGGDPPIFRTQTTIDVRCRCGVRIPAGGSVLGLTFVPSSLEHLFRGGVFCSVGCIRAFCLESLEILDSVDTPSSRAMVTDLAEVHRGVVEALAAIEGRSGS